MGKLSEEAVSISRPRLLVGIDPGVKTGVAVWDRLERRFTDVRTALIVEAMDAVLVLHRTSPVELWFEDARLRTWFGAKGSEALQGAGSIKRDCSVWEEFCFFHNIPFRAVKPVRGATKWNDAYFRNMTRWLGRTSEHARDAGALVFGG